MSRTDIEVRIEGSTFLLRAQTDEGRAFLEKSLGGGPRVGDAYAIAHREARVMIQEILDADLALTRVHEEL